MPDTRLDATGVLDSDGECLWRGAIGGINVAKLLVDAGVDMRSRLRNVSQVGLSHTGLGWCGWMLKVGP